MKLFIIGSVELDSEKHAEFKAFCAEFGRHLASHPISLILCSPYPDSCDGEIIKGLCAAPSINRKLSIELHYPDNVENEEAWNLQLANLNETIKVNRFRHETPGGRGKDAIRYSWLYCQLQAVSIANIIVSMGGRIAGSSNLLLRIAETQKKEIIPLGTFGGVGELFYNRMRYKLQDIWGDDAVLFKQMTEAGKLVDLLVQHPKDANVANLSQKKDLIFFISYSQIKPADADFVEMILRRRNYQVFRDETDIGPGEDIPSSITENIFKSDIFIALWCAEYACSPWCYDELNIALKSHVNKPGKSLWIFALDETRMIHPQARNLLSYPINNRSELEGKISGLLKNALR